MARFVKVFVVNATFARRLTVGRLGQESFFLQFEAHIPCPCPVRLVLLIVKNVPSTKQPRQHEEGAHVCACWVIFSKKTWTTPKFASALFVCVRLSCLMMPYTLVPCVRNAWPRGGVCKHGSGLLPLGRECKKAAPLPSADLAVDAVFSFVFLWLATYGTAAEVAAAFNRRRLTSLSPREIFPHCTVQRAVSRTVYPPIGARHC